MSSTSTDTPHLVEATELIQRIRSHVLHFIEDFVSVRSHDDRTQLQQSIQAVQENFDRLSSCWQGVDELLKSDPLNTVATATSSTQVVEVLQSPAANETTQKEARKIYSKAVLRLVDESLNNYLMRPLYSGLSSGKRLKLAYSPAQQITELAAIAERINRANIGVQAYLCNAGGHVNTSPKDAVEVRLTCPQVFVGSVVLAAPGEAEALRVMVDSWDKAADLEHWGSSQHQVFRRLSALATRVMAYFKQRAGVVLMLGGRSSVITSPSPGPHPPHPSPPASVSPEKKSQVVAEPLPPLPNITPESTALEDLLLWLAGYRWLFKQRCTVTGRLLAWDPSTQMPLPPLFRPFKLSRAELLSVARNPELCRPYHMHVVPEDLLGWPEDMPKVACACSAGNRSSDSGT